MYNPIKKGNNLTPDPLLPSNTFFDPMHPNSKATLKEVPTLLYKADFFQKPKGIRQWPIH